MFSLSNTYSSCGAVRHLDGWHTEESNSSLTTKRVTILVDPLDLRSKQISKLQPKWILSKTTQKSCTSLSQQLSFLRSPAGSTAARTLLGVQLGVQRALTTVRSFAPAPLMRRDAEMASPVAEPELEVSVDDIDLSPSAHSPARESGHVKLETLLQTVKVVNRLHADSMDTTEENWPLTNPMREHSTECASAFPSAAAADNALCLSYTPSPAGSVRPAYQPVGARLLPF